MSVQRNLTALQDQFDKQAIEQLREELNRVSQKLEETEQQLRWAEDSARFWEDQCRLIEENSEVQIGITQQGHVLAINQKTGD